MTERWIYCAVKDQLDLPCAFPNCTCGKGVDPPDDDPPADYAETVGGHDPDYWQ